MVWVLCDGMDAVVMCVWCVCCVMAWVGMCVCGVCVVCNRCVGDIQSFFSIHSEGISGCNDFGRKSCISFPLMYSQFLRLRGRLLRLLASLRSRRPSKGASVLGTPVNCFICCPVNLVSVDFECLKQVMVSKTLKPRTVG